MSSKLREHWSHFFDKIHINDTFRRSTSKSIPREEAYVTLALADASEIEKNETISDHEFNITNRTNFIPIEEVFDVDDRLVLVRGIGGIGKSFFIENMTLQWSKGSLLHNIKHLLVIRGRDLATIETPTFEKLIQAEFHKLSNDVSLDELLDVADQTLIIFDGLDELSEQNRVKICQMLKSTGKNFRILITCRPDPLINFFHRIKDSTKPKLIDVLGFADEHRHTFLNNYYKQHDQKDKTLNSFTRLMDNSAELKALTMIPAYLGTLICLNNHVDNENLPNSKTGLFLLTVIATIQKHNKNLNLANSNMMDICDNEKLLSIVKMLADLSFHCLHKTNDMMLSRKFSEPETNQLMESGLIFKCYSLTGHAYQFRHLLFTEVLAGLHIFLKGKNGVDMYQKFEPSSLLWNALPTVIALHTLLGDIDNGEITVLKKFVFALTKPPKRIIDHLVGSRRVTRKDYSNEISLALLRLIKIASEVDGLNGVITEDTQHPKFTINATGTMLLEALYELKAAPPQLFVKRIERCVLLNVTIKHHHHVQFIANLFEYISEKKKIDQLHLSLSDDVLTNDEIEILQNILQRAKWIRTSSLFDSRLFLSKITQEKGTFVNLETLSLFPESNADKYNEDFKILLSRMGELREVTCSFNNISLEQAEFFGESFIKAKEENRLKTKMVTLSRCEGENLNTVIKCFPAIKKVLIINSRLTTVNLENMSSAINNAADLATNYNKGLMFEHCNLTIAHLPSLSSCFNQLKFLFIYNNKETPLLVRFISEFITHQIIRQEKPTLRTLGFSHLDEDALYQLIPVMNHLKELIIHASELPNEWLKNVHLSVTSNVKLTLDNNLSNEDELVEYFSDSKLNISFQPFLDNLA